jgi:PAS domain S-box-containing protein
MNLPVARQGLRPQRSRAGVIARRAVCAIVAFAFGMPGIAQADAEEKAAAIGDGSLSHQTDTWLGIRAFVREHPGVTTAAAAAVLFQAALIVGLLLQRRRRVRSESALRISEERYREVVESQSDMVCRFREDATLTFVNAAYCKFFGKAREELLGTCFLKLIPEERHTGIRETLNKVVTLRQPVTNEHEVLRPDGTIGWMEWEDFVILNDRGEVEELQGIGRDTTARRRAVDARIEAERNLVHATQLAQLGELTASIAHEINQPLGAILSNAEAAEMLLETGSKEELRAILADIRQDDLRASEVIQHVRELACKRQISVAPLQLNKRVENVLRLLSTDAQRRGVALVSHLQADLPEVQGDRVQIEQVLLNLMLNGMEAMKSTPVDRRRLVVGTRMSSGKAVEISVADGGHGIPPDKLALIFDSFFTTKENGMGLGLALARSIAELHRGHVTAENNPDGGATFRLRLPINGVPITGQMP